MDPKFDPVSPESFSVLYTGIAVSPSSSKVQLIIEGSRGNGNVFVEEICRLCVHKMGKDAPLGYCRTIYENKIVYSSCYNLRKCILYRGYWSSHH